MKLINKLSLLVFVLSILVFVFINFYIPKAEAVNFTIGNSTCSGWGTVELNKSVYAPGETVLVSGNFTGWSPDCGVDSENIEYSKQGSTTRYMVPGSFTAPSSVGAYTVTFYEQLLSNVPKVIISGSTTVTYNVVIPPTVTLNGTSPISYGATSNLNWTSSNTSGTNPCTSSGGGGTGASGSFTTPTLNNTTTYTVTCTGTMGITTTASKTIVVNPQPLDVTVSASPSSIPYNGTSIISWNTTGQPNYCYSSTGNGGNGQTGSFTSPSLQTDTNFSVVCTKNAPSGSGSCLGTHYVQSGQCEGTVVGSIGPNGQAPGPYEGESCIGFSESLCTSGWIVHPCHWNSNMYVPQSCSGFTQSQCPNYSGCTWSPTGGTQVSNNVTVIVQDPPEISLSFQNVVKDLVKASGINQINQSYIKTTPQNFTAGSCSLKNITTNLSSGSPSILYPQNFTVNQIGDQVVGNIFKVTCTDSLSTTSNELKIFGQSGTLSSSSTCAASSTQPACCIPLGQSSCSGVPITFSTKNPMQGITTSVKINNNTVASGNGTSNGANVNSTITVPYGNQTVKLFNKVDGESNGSQVDNEMASISINAVCDTGSTWSSSLSICEGASSPDLVSSAVTPTTAIVAVPTTFSSTITNQGTANTNFQGTQTFTNLFQRGSVLDDANVPIVDLEYIVSGMNSIAPNGTAQTQKSITFNSAGIYYLRVCADNNADNIGTINESTNNNNCGPWTTINVFPTAKPDLIASAPTPISVVATQPTIFSSTITNQGTASTNYQGQATFVNVFHTATGFDDPDHPLGLQGYLSNSTSALGINAQATTTATITFPTAGTYYMRVCADNNIAMNGGVINESIESNNCSNNPWTEITVGDTQTIDLRASAPSPSTAIIGSPLNFTSLITNHGNTSTGSSFNNIFQIATAANGSGTISTISSSPSPMAALAPTGIGIATSAPYTFSGSPTTRSVRACADSNLSMIGSINEGSYEGNNCSSWTNISFTSTTGTINSTDCLIPTGGSLCKTILNWSTMNPIPGVTSAVVTPPNALVRTGNSATNFEYQISYGSRDFYLYHNAVQLAQDSAIASCQISDIWDGSKCVTKNQTTSGDIAATNCYIPEGLDVCDSTITWSTTNPIAGVVSAVTTPLNITVGSGNSGTTTYSVEYGSRNFYLYHNSVELGNDSAVANCEVGTGWDDNKKVCVKGLIGPINGGWSDCNELDYGPCTVSCGGGTQSCIRTCTNPVPQNGGLACQGNPEMERTCNTQACGGGSGTGELTVTLAASPTMIFKGKSSTLTWNSTADTCTSEDFVTGDKPTGSVLVSPIATTTYKITCKKAEVEDSATAAIKVINPVIIEN